MAMIAVIGRSQLAALVAVGVTGIPSFARVTRAQVLSLRKRDFVTAVDAGGSSTYNMFRTILPNSSSPILVQVVVLASRGDPSRGGSRIPWRGNSTTNSGSWGEMLRTGKSFLHEAPYYAILPGLVLTLTILSFNSIGRALTSLLEDRQEVVAELRVERAKP